MAEREVITAEESIREQRRLHPYFKPEVTPAITMVIPGRRAFGETWTKVVIGHDADSITVDTSPAEAPADNRPIMAMAGPDAEYANYILAAQMEKAHARAVAPQALTPAERFAVVNEAWQAFMEQKLRHLRGVSTIGAGGLFQRQRVTQNPENRPTMRKW